nr:uncharacterized protein LOC113802182 [Penaeus vannamei]
MMVYVISNNSGLDNDLQITDSVVGNASLPSTRENEDSSKENVASIGNDGRGNCTKQGNPPSAPNARDAEVVQVCKSCQHLYDGQPTVVLTPNTLAHAHHHHPSPRKQTKPWAARRYEGLCVCAETGGVCRCGVSKASKWQRLLPRNAPWWPRTKVVLLTLAALTPWACLVVYFIFAYRK